MSEWIILGGSGGWVWVRMDEKLFSMGEGEWGWVHVFQPKELKKANDEKTDSKHLIPYYY